MIELQSFYSYIIVATLLVKSALSIIFSSFSIVDISNYLFYDFFSIPLKSGGS